MEIYGFIGMIVLFAIVVYVSIVMSKSKIQGHKK